MHTIAVLAVDDVLAFDVAVVIEAFRWARHPDGSAAYRCIVAGPERTARAGPMSIVVPNGLDELVAADTVVVPGRHDPVAPVDARGVTAVRAAAERGARVASICVGALDLAVTGLLDGRRATTHWRAAALLAARHPSVQVDAAALFVDEGDVLTSAGAAAGLDLCLHMIERDFGSAMALDAARSAVMPLARPGGQSQFVDRPALAADAESLAPVLTWMEAELGSALTLESIATRAHLSVRSLSRRFQRQLGTTPLGWLTAARVRAARAMLETTDLPIDAVAARSGLRSAGNLRARFSAQLGTSPTAYRAAFRRAGRT